ncbi:MAG: alpha/beta fold hydrolase, partial [Acidimicrobiia bacterium]|nr:alpha/beta fold hydrolase [Acidimicrobiia bacterium]
MTLRPVAQRLVDSLVAVYPEVLSRGLLQIGIAPDLELEAASEDAMEWLRSELEQLLAQPFIDQRRGPLQVFQEAFAGPSELLMERGIPALERDEITANALPGDHYGLAPASTREISDGVFDAHISWGIEKAKAMRGLVMGRPLGFEETGESDSVVVFIHGFPLDHRMWLPLAPSLEETHRCIMLDLAGRGRSDTDPARTIEDHAADVLATIEQIEAESLHVVGLSMGGYIALALAEMAPDRLSSVVLVDTRSTADDEVGRDGRNNTIQSITDGEVAEVVGGMVDKLVTGSAPEQIRELIITMGLAVPEETLIADLAAMRDRPDRT